MRATLLKISGIIFGVIVLIAVLSLNFGIGLPSLLVAVGFYGGLLLWLGGKIARFGVRRWRGV
ncbi:hypothetical protein ACW9KT_11205 [Hymenobacter sp. HD11105]